MRMFRLAVCVCVLKAFAQRAKVLEGCYVACYTDKTELLAEGEDDGEGGRPGL